MIRINLLPVRTSRRLEAVKQELILGGVGIGLLVVICAVVFMFQSARANDLRRTNSRLQEDLDNLRLIVARVDEVEKINEELRRKLSVIGNLQASKTGPVHILDELSAATPEKLYLLDLKQEGAKIDLTGNAASNEVISQFLINLEKTAWFEDVYLISIDQLKLNEYDLKHFEVSARIVVPAPDATASAEKPASQPPAGEEDPQE